MLVNRRTIHVEWGDCDPLGIVYFPRYFEFFDACTNGLFERAGLPKQEMLKKYAIAGIPLVESRARFLLPPVGDTVVVESNITEWGKASFSVHHRLFKGEELAVEVLKSVCGWFTRQAKKVKLKARLFRGKLSKDSSNPKKPPVSELLFVIAGSHRLFGAVQDNQFDDYVVAIV